MTKNVDRWAFDLWFTKRLLPITAQETKMDADVERHQCLSRKMVIFIFYQLDLMQSWDWDFESEGEFLAWCQLYEALSQIAAPHMWGSTVLHDTLYIIAHVFTIISRCKTKKVLLFFVHTVALIKKSSLVEVFQNSTLRMTLAHFPAFQHRTTKEHLCSLSFNGSNSPICMRKADEDKFTEWQFGVYTHQSCHNT